MRRRGLREAARQWGSRPEERARDYPADRYLAGPVERWTRAVSVGAPAAVTWRWICQLTVAPYSYDLLDNLGRRSPRELTPGAERLVPGDRLMVFRVLDVAPGRRVSGVVLPRGRRLFGPLAVTYAAEPEGADASRLVSRLVVPAGGGARGAARELLALGDLVMMRKQLLTLRDLAERTAQGSASR